MINRIKLPQESTTIIYLTVIYIVGIVGMLTQGTRALFITLVPINILMAAAVAGIYHQAYNSRFIIACIAVYLGGFGIEWLGVKTGAIFGGYTYEEGLGFQVLGVPPIMGLNWLLLVYGSSSIAARIVHKKYLIAIIGALLMVIYDILLEPTAINYHFWTWDGNLIPLQNYMAWFICAFVFICFFNVYVRNRVKNTVAEAIFWLQFIFFGVIAIFNNLTV